MQEQDVKTSRIDSKPKSQTPISKGKIHVITERCKGCGICIEFCRTGVLRKSDKTNQQGYHIPEADPEKACIACKRCEKLCPDFAIWIEKVNKRGKEDDRTNNE